MIKPRQCPLKIIERSVKLGFVGGFEEAAHFRAGRYAPVDQVPAQQQRAGTGIFHLLLLRHFFPVGDRIARWQRRATAVIGLAERRPQAD
ncbi:MAG: hypothetical protein KDH97_22110, partial [Calditrichaeota bacterium]|nr:hypothetical protein [Calditrichota bacterium]